MKGLVFGKGESRKRFKNIGFKAQIYHESRQRNEKYRSFYENISLLIPIFMSTYPTAIIECFSYKKIERKIDKMALLGFESKVFYYLVKLNFK